MGGVSGESSVDRGVNKGVSSVSGTVSVSGGGRVGG